MTNETKLQMIKEQLEMRIILLEKSIKESTENMEKYWNNNNYEMHAFENAWKGARESELMGLKEMLNIL